MSGNINAIGAFDQCLNIAEEKNETIIRGQYCTVTLTPSAEFANEQAHLLDVATAINYIGINIGSNTKDVINSIKMTYGVCLPSSCTVANLQNMWNYVEHTFRIPVHLSFSDISCRSKDRPVEPYAVDLYIMSAFVAYIVLLSVSTLYEVLFNSNIRENDEPESYLLAFSLYANFKKLFTFNQTTDERTSNLKCISGIKVISMLWIVFGHRIVLNMFSANINSASTFQWWKRIENTPFMAASFAVDTFFVLSGLLLTYVFLKSKHVIKERGFPIGLFYFYRFLRLSPALLAVILFYISIFKHIGDGPIWPILMRRLGWSCCKIWWMTLFYMSNFIPVKYQCLEQSWYLAVDTQLYIISPIILTNLLKSAKKTISICLIVCLMSAVYSYVITIQYKYGAIYYEGNMEFYHNIYMQTFVRMPSWLIGVIAGYCIATYQGIKIPKGISLCIWVYSLSVMTFLVLIHVVFARSGYEPVRSALFNACARPAWTISVSLIVFLCVTGHGGMVNTFLSLPIFQVLVRLSYSMYLVNIGIFLFSFGRNRTPGYFSNFDSMYQFIGDIFLTFLIGTVCCLAFETPFLNIGKILMRKGTVNFEVKKVLAKSKPEAVKKNKNRKDFPLCLNKYKDLHKIE